jgi:hypothetical protein
MAETAEKERLKRRLEVLSGGAARVSKEEAKETEAKHKAVLIAKRPQTVFERLRMLAGKGKRKVSSAVSRLRRRKKKKKKKRNVRHRLP